MRTLVRQTSIEAYRQLPLTDQQQDIILVLRTLGKSCIADIAEQMKMQRSTVAGRMNELKKIGAIEFVDKKRSLTTGIMSEFWKIKEFKETLF